MNKMQNQSQKGVQSPALAGRGDFFQVLSEWRFTTAQKLKKTVKIIINWQKKRKTNLRGKLCCTDRFNKHTNYRMCILICTIFKKNGSGVNKSTLIGRSVRVTGKYARYGWHRNIRESGIQRIIIATADGCRGNGK